MRVLIVTAADENFFVLVEGLLRSLYQWKSRLFTDIAVFDLGLKPDSREWIGKAARHIVTPEWDLPVPEATRLRFPHYRAMTARPFLPRYFPGYDVYVWIDADAWVQERFALEWLIAVAAEGRLAAVPEAHPSYVTPPDLLEWKRGMLRQFFGPDAEKRIRLDTYLNSGVVALKAGAPHWDRWAEWFRIGLANAPGAHVCDQTALNHAIWTDGLPVTLLPPLCNWMCHLALPRFDPERWRFCEPDGEGRPLGIVHLTWRTKNLKMDRGAGNPDGLRYPGERRQPA